MGDPRLAPLVLLPAPTSRASARERGGCIVEAAARVAARQLNQDSIGAGGAGVTVVAAARLADGAADSVGLGRAQRQANITGNLRIDAAAVTRAMSVLRTPGARACIVDDVITTGATMSGFAAALAAQGVVCTAGIVLAQA